MVKATMSSKISIKLMMHDEQLMMRTSCSCSGSTMLVEGWRRRVEWSMHRKICCVDCSKANRSIVWNHCWLCSALRSSTTTISTMSVIWRWVALNKTIQQLIIQTSFASFVDFAWSLQLHSRIVRCGAFFPPLYSCFSLMEMSLNQWVVAHESVDISR